MKSTEIEQVFYHKLGREVFVYIKVNYWAIKKDLHPPMSIELSATFSRKYGPASFPDWTITYFKQIMLLLYNSHRLKQKYRKKKNRKRN